MPKEAKSNLDNDLVLETSLQAYFYEQLQDVNSKSIQPLPNETIFYSSMVMDRLGESQNYFDITEGKVREKTLGLKMLEAGQLSQEKRKRVLRDIGDTALLLCGYFAESLNNKIVDISYYQNLGQMAYCKLNHLVPEVYEVPYFFNLLSKRFDALTTVMGIVSQNLQSNNNYSDGILLIIDNLNVKKSF